jgi:hypothetical protein
MGVSLENAMLDIQPTPHTAQPIDHDIVGREAWTRENVNEADWRVILPAPAIEEIRQVAESLTRSPVPLLALRPDSFDMPHCRAAMHRVSEILSEGVKFALVQKLPMDALTDDMARSIYWILASMVSRPVAQKLDGTMIYDVTDTGAKPLPGSGVRPDKSNVDLQFHNDNSYNAVMPDVVALLCIRRAAQGGQSRVMSFATAHNALRERFPDVLPRLYAPFWFDRQREHAPDEEPIFAAPVFTNDNGRLLARLGQHQIRNGYALRGDMDVETERAIAAVDEVFRDLSLQFEFDMQPGEMQFAKNCEVGHSRTEFADFAEPERRRLLVRLWLRDKGTPGYIG